MLVDLDTVATWPAELVALIHWLDAEVPPAQAAGDLDLPYGADDQLRQLLAGHELLVYHATRLLDHELDLIHANGLRVFNRDLFEDKLEQAFKAGALSAAQCDELRATQLYAQDEEDFAVGSREGNLCLILGRSALLDGTNLGLLLKTWGGEGLYFAHKGDALEALLRSIGRPAIVVAAVPVAPSEPFSAPDLAKVFLGAHRKMDADASLSQPAAIPPTKIRAIWQPGDELYDSFSDLPQA